MSSDIPRRDFLKNSIAWAAGVGTGPTNFLRAAEAAAPAVGLVLLTQLPRLLKNAIEK